mgnify:FL=1
MPFEWSVQDYEDGVGVCLALRDQAGRMFVRNAVRCRAVELPGRVHRDLELLPDHATSSRVLEEREFPVSVPETWSRDRQIAYAKRLLRRWWRDLRVVVRDRRDGRRDREAVVRTLRRSFVGVPGSRPYPRVLEP